MEKQSPYNSPERRWALPANGTDLDQDLNQLLGRLAWSDEAVVPGRRVSDQAEAFVEHIRYAQEARTKVVGFKPTPEFSAQLNDKTRQNQLEVLPGYTLPNQVVDSEDATITVTEHEALANLDAFLREAERTIASSDKAVRPAFGLIDASNVSNFRESLTFIGEKELIEATQGIAAYWKAFLDENTASRILIMEPNSPDFHEPSEGELEPGSEEYIAHRIVDEFSAIASKDTELMQRVVSLKSAGTDIKPEDKIVITDDWASSESGVRLAYRKLGEYLETQGRSSCLGNAEVNLVVVRENQLSEGVYDDPHDHDQLIPVVAYYRAPAVTEMHEGPLASGSHSTNDFGFSYTLNGFGRAMSRIKGRSVDLPLVTQVIPPYKPYKKNATR